MGFKIILRAGGEIAGGDIGDAKELASGFGTVFCAASSIKIIKLVKGGDNGHRRGIDIDSVIVVAEPNNPTVNAFGAAQCDNFANSHQIDIVFLKVSNRPGSTR